MGDAPRDPGAPADSQEISYQNYLNLIRQLDELVEMFENHPDPATREQVTALLSGLDMLHHEGLGRLVEFFRNQGIGEYLDFATQDPVIRTLLGLYGLANLDLAEAVPESAPVFVPLERLTVKGKPVNTRGKEAM